MLATAGRLSVGAEVVGVLLLLLGAVVMERGTAAVGVRGGVLRALMGGIETEIGRGMVIGRVC